MKISNDSDEVRFVVVRIRFATGKSVDTPITIGPRDAISVEFTVDKPNGLKINDTIATLDWVEE